MMRITWDSVSSLLPLLSTTYHPLDSARLRIIPPISSSFSRLSYTSGSSPRLPILASAESVDTSTRMRASMGGKRVSKSLYP